MGSVFSPYYAFARRSQPADPEHFCAINVALYGRNSNRWAMTERGRRSLQRTVDRFQVGPSAMQADGDGLKVEIDEIGMPIPHRIKGRVHLQPHALGVETYALDADGRHHWQPIAPNARVDVAFTHPAIRFSGHGYLDSNWGDEPLERGFRFWTWSRGRIGERSVVLYDCERQDGSRSNLALSFSPAGAVEHFSAPPESDLPQTLWRVPRPTRSDAGRPAGLLRTLEDTPFYTRSIIRSSIGGEVMTGVHESLSLDRFSRGVVQCMLPFRMPRRS